jgi:hypothetical protein
MNTRCTCEKDIPALRLLKDNWRTGASRLQHDVTCVGACKVTAILCVNPIRLYWTATINKYFNMGCVTFDHSVFYMLKFTNMTTVRIFEVIYCNSNALGISRKIMHSNKLLNCIIDRPNLYFLLASPFIEPITVAVRSEAWVLAGWLLR